MKKSAILILLSVAVWPLFSQNFSGGYHFVLPEFDSTSQLFLPQFPAVNIDESMRITAAGPQFKAGGIPVRFWGVNITSSGVFPEKSQAPAIAARMRKMGINLVRFHHLESNWTTPNGCIFNYSLGSRQLNPDTRDRLDYFIAQLKRNGIYVNMNLNVSRVFQESDGVAGADSMPDFAKGVTLFDPYLQFLQREYAEQLLGHINPYTGMSLAVDPVLAMVETNNENSLYGFWKENRLRPFDAGGGIMTRHSVLLDSLWGAWLRTKYSTQTALETAWNVGLTTPGSGELLLNKGFETGLDNPWTLELHDNAQALIATSVNSPHSGNYCMRFQVTTVTGTDWHIQFKQAGFPLQKDSTYTVKLFARASQDAAFSVTAMRDNDPYNWYGGQTFQATTAWQEFSFSFLATEDNINAGRISISPMQSTGTFYFDDFSIAPPVVSGVLPGENLLNGTVRRINFSEKYDFSLPRFADMAAFYHDVQKGHFDDLRTYLKNTLNVLAPITGTNALVGPADASLHEDMDYLDDHSYWDHPWFPNGAWDPYDWQISNEPMVKSGDFGAITNAMSGLTFLNKPYTVSEYNHAAPNRFRTEMPHAVLAYGAFHGMDGVMFFDYNSGFDWGGDFVGGFFAINRDHSVMGLFPSCAAAFRQGWVQEEPNPVVVQYSAQGVSELARADDQYRWGHFLPYDTKRQLTHSIRTATYEGTENSDFQSIPQGSTGYFVTTTGETHLDTDSGVLTTSTPHFVAVTGFLQDANPVPNSSGMRVLQADDFGSVTWVSCSETPLSTAKRTLLTIASKQQNDGMIWDGLNTVHNNWGGAPTVQDALVISLELGIAADSIHIFTLDGQGKDHAFRTIYPVSNGTFQVEIDQNMDGSMWYGIEAFGGNIVGVQTLATTTSMRVYPNPVNGSELHISTYAETPEEVHIRLLDVAGKVVGPESVRYLSAGNQTFTLPIPEQLKGIFWVEMRGANGVRVVGKIYFE